MSDRRWVVVAAGALAVAAALCLPAALAAPAATASPGMLIGIYDEGATFYDDSTQVFTRYQALGVKVLRVNLYWGGKLGVAKSRRSW